MAFEIRLETGDDARDVLFLMQEIIERYGIVTVHDVYCLANRADRARHSDIHSGWMGDNLDVDIALVNDDYCIMRLPDPKPISINA